MVTNTGKAEWNDGIYTRAKSTSLIQSHAQQNSIFLYSIALYIYLTYCYITDNQIKIVLIVFLFFPIFFNRFQYFTSHFNIKKRK